MKALIASLVLLFSPLFTDAMNAAVSERAVIVSSEPSNADWNGGMLMLLAKDTQEKLLTVSFKMPKGHLTSMVISARDWVLDLTSQVSRLEQPFPTRMQVWLYKVDSRRNISDLWLAVPYSPEPDKCRELKFEIVNGRISRTLGTSLVSKEICGP